MLGRPCNVCTRRIRRERPTPVVMMTASREERDLIRSYELGVNAYVVKPTKFQDFVETVKQVSGFWAVMNEVPECLRTAGSASVQPSRATGNI